MCGISGFIAKQGNFLPESLIYNMTNLINHRGLDDEGYLLFTKEGDIITAGGTNTPDEVWKASINYRPVRNTNVSSKLIPTT